MIQELKNEESSNVVVIDRSLELTSKTPDGNVGQTIKNLKSEEYKVSSVVDKQTGFRNKKSQNICRLNLLSPERYDSDKKHQIVGKICKNFCKKEGIPEEFEGSGVDVDAKDKSELRDSDKGFTIQKHECRSSPVKIQSNSENSTIQKSINKQGPIKKALSQTRPKSLSIRLFYEIDTPMEQQESSNPEKM